MVRLSVREILLHVRTLCCLESITAGNCGQMRDLFRDAFEYLGDTDFQRQHEKHTHLSTTKYVWIYTVVDSAVSNPSQQSLGRVIHSL